jgi:hypothetical protein
MIHNTVPRKSFINGRSLRQMIVKVDFQEEALLDPVGHGRLCPLHGLHNGQ